MGKKKKKKRQDTDDGVFLEEFEAKSCLFLPLHRKSWYWVFLKRFPLWTSIDVRITTPVKTVFWLGTRTVPGLSLDAPRMPRKQHSLDCDRDLCIVIVHLRNIAKILLHVYLTCYFFHITWMYHYFPLPILPSSNMVLFPFTAGEFKVSWKGKPVCATLQVKGLNVWDCHARISCLETLRCFSACK